MATARRKTPDVVITVKRGDSFQPVQVITDDADAGPYDYSEWSARCQVRQPDNALIVSGFVVDWIDHAAGIFQIFPTVDTNSWPLGDLLMDIQFTTDIGEVVSTDTFAIRVIEDVTRTDPSDPESPTAS